MAYIIDWIVLSIAQWIILFILGALGLGVGASSSNGFDFASMTEGDIVEMVTAISGMLFAGGMIGIAIGILYFVLMESRNHWQNGFRFEGYRHKWQ